MKLYDLKVNHLSNPLGFEMRKPVFSWKVQDARGKKQTEARIKVYHAKKQKVGELIFDTGFSEKVSSLGTAVDMKLTACTKYFWNVTVRTDAGEEEVSDFQWFETGKMDEEWDAKWISCDNALKRHPIFKKQICLKEKVQNARLYICGLGLYEAHYNGKRVGNEFLAPYCNDYNEWVQYQTYDITEMLSEDGILSVMLGNGWYKGRFGFDVDSEERYYGNEWKLCAELQVEYQDGSKETFITDENWSVERSNLLFSDIYDGEQWDDTLLHLPEEKAVLCEAPKGKLTGRLSTPVTVHEIFIPKELLITPAGETVLDLGQEFSGIFSLHVNEPVGTKIHIQTGEVLQNGNFYRDNLRTAKSEFVYISDGIEKDIYPHFTFYGYRYVKITGMQNLKKEDFKGWALYSDIPQNGDILTGNELVNQLLSNIRWGMKSNFLDVPTDCPQRDERMGWTGDAQIFSQTATYLVDTYPFYKKYLYDMSCVQRSRNGKVPQVIPTFGKEGTSSGWGDAACIIPWNLYLFYGDKTILEEQYESMKSWVDYIKNIDGENHRWREEFHYGDWLALDHPLGGENGVLGGTDERFIADVFYAASVEIVKKSANILEYDKDEKEYAQLEEKIRNWIKDEYYTKTGKCCIRTQTAQLLTLKYGLSDVPEEAKKMLATLLDESNGKLKTGFIGTPLLCKVLSENNMDEYAYELFLNEQFPGWLNEVKQGATTIWERWNSLDENGNISGTQMNSLNHYASGAIAEWMFKYVAGINVLEENQETYGFQKVRFTPRLHKALGKVEAYYNSASGTYRSNWEFLDDETVRITVEIPFGGSAELFLPDAGEEVLQDKRNPMFQNVKEGKCMLEAGEYSAEYRIVGKTCKYSVDTSMRQLLKNEGIRQFIGSMIPLDALPNEFMPLSFRKLAIQFGNAQEEQLNQIDAVLSTF